MSAVKQAMGAVTLRIIETATHCRMLLSGYRLASE
jgi:hypothetical protein